MRTTLFSSLFSSCDGPQTPIQLVDFGDGAALYLLAYPRAGYAMRFVDTERGAARDGQPPVLTVAGHRVPGEPRALGAYTGMRWGFAELPTAEQEIRIVWQGVTYDVTLPEEACRD